MPDLSDILERANRAVQDVPLPPDGLEAVRRRRERRRRNQRLGAGVVAVAVFLLAVLALRHAFPTGDVPADHPVTPSVVTPSVTRSDALSEEWGSRGPAFLVDATTGDKSKLPDDIAQESVYGDFTVTPDGRQVVFVGSGSALYIADMQGTNLRQLVSEPVEAADPRWSPDGMKIAYVDRHTGSDDARLYVLDVTTGERGRPLDSGELWLPSFSPDGQTILYTKTFVDGDRKRLDLWTVPAGGGEPKLVMQRSAFGAYSPDGKAIAYRYAISLGDDHLMIGTQEVWLADVGGAKTGLLSTPDSTGVVAETWSRTNTARPTWSPDGTRVAFDDFGDVFVADVTTGKSVKLTSGVNPAWLDDETLIVEDCDPTFFTMPC